MVSFLFYCVLFLFIGILYVCTIISKSNKYGIFEYHIKPTWDFYQLLLAQGDQIEVIEPESVRDELLDMSFK